MLLSFYLLSVLCSTYLVLCSEKFTVHTMGIAAVLFHIMAFYILLKPVYKIDELRYSTLKKVPERTIVHFTLFIVLVEIVDFFANIGTVSINSILEDANGLRQEMVGSGLGLANNSFIAYFHVFAQEFQLVPLVLFFYWAITYPKNKGVIILLLIVSLFYPILSLRVVSRDVIIRYLVLFIIFYYLLSPKISQTTKKRIGIFFSIVAFLFIGLFFIISTSRFGATSNYDNSMSYSFLFYFGQGFANFSDRFVLSPDGIFPNSHGSIHFPIIPGEGRSSLFLSDETNVRYSLNTFPTSIGTWIEDCGIAISCFILFIYAFLIRVISNIKTKNVFTLIYYIWVYDFIYMSVFYFDAKVYIYKILAILFIVYLDYSTRRSVTTFHLHA